MTNDQTKVLDAFLSRNWGIVLKDLREAVEAGVYHQDVTEAIENLKLVKEGLECMVDFPEEFPNLPVTIEEHQKMIKKAADLRVKARKAWEEAHSRREVGPKKWVDHGKTSRGEVMGKHSKWEKNRDEKREQNRARALGGTGGKKKK